MYFITHFIVYKKINAKSLNNNMIQKKLDEKMMFQNKLTLAIDAYKENTAGFLVLLSNTIKDSAYALQVYRDKDLVEKTFDDLKNSMDSKRLRVHLDESMKGRLFIQFIALIFISYISKIAHEKGVFKLFGSVAGILDELKLYNEVSISGQRQKICSERTKAQKVILEAFGLSR